LFREDCLLRIQHLQMEVNADLKQMEQGKKELAAIEEGLKRMTYDLRLVKQLKVVSHTR